MLGWLTLLTNRTSLIPNGLDLLVFKSHLTFVLNIRHGVGLEDLINTFMVDNSSRSLGHIVQRHLRHVQIRVKCFNLMEALLKTIVIEVTELGKKVVRVTKLCLLVFLSSTDLLP